MDWYQMRISFVLFFVAMVTNADIKNDIKTITKLRDILQDDMKFFQPQYEIEKNIFDHGKLIVPQLDEIVTVYRKDGKIDAVKSQNASSEIEEYNELFREYIPVAWKAFFRATGLILPSVWAISALNNLEREAS